MSTSRSRRRKLTDEERAEKRAAEREKMAAAVDALRSSEGWQRWLSVRRSFHRYSAKNTILIAHQCPHATFVASYGDWRKRGYYVREGEHHIAVWGPMHPSKKRIERWKDEGADPDKKPVTHFRLVPVFDRSQVEPLPAFSGERQDLTPPSRPVEGEDLAPLLGPLAEFSGSIGYSFAIEPVPGSANGYCDPGAKRIVVDVVSEGFSPNGQVKTGIHEDAHALVRADRQDDDPDLTYGEEEVVAECVAYTVAGAVGLDTSGESVPYVTGWGQSEHIARYAELIDRLARRLEDALLRHLPEASERSEARALAA